MHRLQVAPSDTIRDILAKLNHSFSPSASVSSLKIVRDNLSDEWVALPLLSHRTNFIGSVVPTRRTLQEQKRLVDMRHLTEEKRSEEESSHLGDLKSSELFVQAVNSCLRDLPLHENSVCQIPVLNAPFLGKTRMVLAARFQEIFVVSFNFGPLTPDQSLLSLLIEDPLRLQHLFPTSIELLTEWFESTWDEDDGRLYLDWFAFQSSKEFKQKLCEILSDRSLENRSITAEPLVIDERLARGCALDSLRILFVFDEFMPLIQRGIGIQMIATATKRFPRSPAQTCLALIDSYCNLELHKSVNGFEPYWGFPPFRSVSEFGEQSLRNLESFEFCASIGRKCFEDLLISLSPETLLNCLAHRMAPSVLPPEAMIALIQMVVSLVVTPVPDVSTKFVSSYLLPCIGISMGPGEPRVLVTALNEPVLAILARVQLRKAMESALRALNYFRDVISVDIGKHGEVAAQLLLLMSYYSCLPPDAFGLPFVPLKNYIMTLCAIPVDQLGILDGLYIRLGQFIRYYSKAPVSREYLAELVPRGCGLALPHQYPGFDLIIPVVKTACIGSDLLGSAETTFLSVSVKNNSKENMSRTIKLKAYPNFVRDDSPTFVTLYLDVGPGQMKSSISKKKTHSEFSIYTRSLRPGNISDEFQMCDSIFESLVQHWTDPLSMDAYSHPELREKILSFQCNSVASVSEDEDNDSQEASEAEDDDGHQDPTESSEDPGGARLGPQFGHYEAHRGQHPSEHHVQSWPFQGMTPSDQLHEAPTRAGWELAPVGSPLSSVPRPRKLARREWP